MVAPVYELRDSWRAITSRISGSMSSFPPMIPRLSALWKLWGRGGQPPRRALLTAPSFLRVFRPMWRKKVGLRTRAQTSFYDLAIVGGGPAGLAAPCMAPPKACTP